MASGGENGVLGGETSAASNEQKPGASETSGRATLLVQAYLRRLETSMEELERDLKDSDKCSRQFTRLSNRLLGLLENVPSDNSDFASRLPAWIDLLVRVVERHATVANVRTHGLDILSTVCRFPAWRQAIQSAYDARDVLARVVQTVSLVPVISLSDVKAIHYLLASSLYGCARRGPHPSYSLPDSTFRELLNIVRRLEGRSRNTRLRELVSGVVEHLVRGEAGWEAMLEAVSKPTELIPSGNNNAEEDLLQPAPLAVFSAIAIVVHQMRLPTTTTAGFCCGLRLIHSLHDFLVGSYRPLAWELLGAPLLRLWWLTDDRMESADSENNEASEGMPSLAVRRAIFAHGSAVIDEERRTFTQHQAMASMCLNESRQQGELWIAAPVDAADVRNWMQGVTTSLSTQPRNIRVWVFAMRAVANVVKLNGSVESAENAERVRALSETIPVLTRLAAECVSDPTAPCEIARVACKLLLHVLNGVETRVMGIQAVVPHSEAIIRRLEGMPQLGDLDCALMECILACGYYQPTLIVSATLIDRLYVVLQGQCGPAAVVVSMLRLMKHYSAENSLLPHPLFNTSQLNDARPSIQSISLLVCQRIVEFLLEPRVVCQHMLASDTLLHHTAVLRDALGAINCILRQSQESEVKERESAWWGHEVAILTPLSAALRQLTSASDAELAAHFLTLARTLWSDVLRVSVSASGNADAVVCGRAVVAAVVHLLTLHVNIDAVVESGMALLKFIVGDRSYITSTLLGEICTVDLTTLLTGLYEATRHSNAYTVFCSVACTLLDALTGAQSEPAVQAIREQLYPALAPDTTVSDRTQVEIWNTLARPLYSNLLEMHAVNKLSTAALDLHFPAGHFSRQKQEKTMLRTRANAMVAGWLSAMERRDAPPRVWQYKFCMNCLRGWYLQEASEERCALVNVVYRFLRACDWFLSRPLREAGLQDPRALPSDSCQIAGRASDDTDKQLFAAHNNVLQVVFIDQAVLIQVTTVTAIFDAFLCEATFRSAALCNIVIYFARNYERLVRKQAATIILRLLEAILFGITHPNQGDREARDVLCLVFDDGSQPA